MLLRHRDDAPSCWKCKHMQTHMALGHCAIVTEADGSAVQTGLARSVGAPCGPAGRPFEAVTKQPEQGVFRCMFRRLRWC